jgi:hypothetical protein
MGEMVIRGISAGLSCLFLAWCEGSRRKSWIDRKMSFRRRAMFGLAMMAMTLGVIEILAAGLLMIQPNILNGQATSIEDRNTRLVNSIAAMLEDRPDALARFDGELGWRPRAGLDNGVDIVNSQALRSHRDYADDPASGVLRMAAFGDSFVYGSEVLTDESWARVIERSRPNTEALNYGVPGYGQDQVYLRFLAEGRDFKPKVVLFGVASPTLDRIMMISGVFRSPGSLIHDFVKKPRFLLDGDRLSPAPNHLRQPSDFEPYMKDPSSFRELGAYDYWYEPLIYESWLFEHSHAARLVFAGWATTKRRLLDPDRPLKGPKGRGVFNASSSGFRILRLILERFVATATDWDMHPVVLILPDGYSTERMRSGQPGVMDPVRKLCVDEGWDCIDAKDAFLAQPEESEAASWFENSFHYSVEGNRIVADWIVREIDRREL